MGYACDIPGIRRVARDQIDDLVDQVQGELDLINSRRDEFIADVSLLKQQILDSYAHDDCYSEVEKALYRWVPNLSRMEPIFGVSDLEKGTGLVCSSRVQEAILKSELATKKAMIETLEDEVLDVLERCHKPKRVRGQLSAINGLITKLAPIIREFSSSPDLIEKLDSGLVVLKSIPQDCGDNEDGLRSRGDQEGP